MSEKPEVRHTPAPWDPYPKTGVRFVELSIDDYRHAVRCVNAHAETLAESLLSSSEERRNRRRHQPQPECAYGDPVCDCAEAREVHCPSCSKAGGADMTVSHAPPVCDPKPQPEARELVERIRSLFSQPGLSSEELDAAIEREVAPLVADVRMHSGLAVSFGKKLLKADARISELAAERDALQVGFDSMDNVCTEQRKRAERAEAERDHAQKTQRQTQDRVADLKEEVGAWQQRTASSLVTIGKVKAERDALGRMCDDANERADMAEGKLAEMEAERKAKNP